MQAESCTVRPRTCPFKQRARLRRAIVLRALRRHLRGSHSRKCARTRRVVVEVAKRKVAIQVNTSAVGTRTRLQPVRVCRHQHIHDGAAAKLFVLVARCQTIREAKKHLNTRRLVAVHATHEANARKASLVVVVVVVVCRHLEHPEITPERASSDRVQLRRLRMAACNQRKRTRDCRVAVVRIRCHGWHVRRRQRRCLWHWCCYGGGGRRR
mmetsp:Transcript_2571/g.6443  ORF Transcript_2571/g.6443 Transcript_2571/m.6443 type:complete len:211 (-) Transcript_2571:1166-1798(-)